MSRTDSCWITARTERTVAGRRIVAYNLFYSSYSVIVSCQPCELFGVLMLYATGFRIFTPVPALSEPALPGIVGQLPPIHFPRIIASYLRPLGCFGLSHILRNRRLTIKIIGMHTGCFQ